MNDGQGQDHAASATKLGLTVILGGGALIILAGTLLPRAPQEHAAPTPAPAVAAAPTSVPTTCHEVRLARLSALPDPHLRGVLCTVYQGTAEARSRNSVDQLAECIGAMGDVAREWRTRFKASVPESAGACS